MPEKLSIDVLESHLIRYINAAPFNHVRKCMHSFSLSLFTSSLALVLFLISTVKINTKSGSRTIMSHPWILCAPDTIQRRHGASHAQLLALSVLHRHDSDRVTFTLNLCVPQSHPMMFRPLPPDVVPSHCIQQSTRAFHKLLDDCANFFMI